LSLEARPWGSLLLRVARKGLRDIEIEDLDDALGRDHDVGGLQIAVDDAFVVGRLERLCNLQAETQCVFDRQRAAFKLLLEGFALDELHRDMDRDVLLIEPCGGASLCKGSLDR
jgi:hypothetical protein